jgi:SsrA-binding protein
MNAITTNKRAYFDYEILETYEAGIELYGFEVKAVKTGHINLTGAYAIIKDNQAWLLNATVPPYQPKNIRTEYDHLRSRRLLLHKSEIKELIGKTTQKGLTIIPLKVYTKRSRVKILIGLARHKKSADKRETIKKRDTEREVRRVLKL